MSSFICPNCRYESPLYLTACPRCGTEVSSTGGGNVADTSLSARKIGKRMEYQRHCPRCDYETNDALRQCPQCGNRLVSTKLVRGLGWVMVVLGLFLIGIMAMLIVWVANIISETGRPGATARFTGTPSQARMIFGLFGLILLFGIVALVNGVWQIHYGKRNRKLAGIIFLLGFLFLLIGMFARFFW